MNREMESSVPPPAFWEKKRGYGWNNELINHAYLVKLYKDLKGWSMESFPVGEHVEI